MGATNSTTYYNLSQFIGTDKPAWLQDYNGDMLKIDTAINAAKVAADNAANAASAAQGDATTALGDIASLNTTVGTISNTLNTAVGNINTINSLIGNGTPTTTDQTIIGAINEINAKVSGIRVIKTPSATAVSITADGVKSYSALLNDLTTAYNAYVAALGADESAEILYLRISSLTNLVPQAHQTALTGTYGAFGTNGTRSLNYCVQHISAGWRLSSDEIQSDNSVAHTNLTNDVPANTVTLEVRVRVYKDI